MLQASEHSYKNKEATPDTNDPFEECNDISGPLLAYVSAN